MPAPSECFEKFSTTFTPATIVIESFHVTRIDSASPSAIFNDVGRPHKSLSATTSDLSVYTVSMTVATLLRSMPSSWCLSISEL